MNQDLDNKAQKQIEAMQRVHGESRRAIRSCYHLASSTLEDPYTQQGSVWIAMAEYKATLESIRDRLSHLVH